MSELNQACPPGPNNQSVLNFTTQDKFVMVLNLPQVLKDKAKEDPIYDIKNLEMSVFGTVIPPINVPSIDTRIMGQSVKFSSIARPEYSPLNITFIVDNQFKNYFLLWKWLTIYNDPRESIYTGPNKNTKSLENEYQTTFSILSLNEYNTPIVEFKFHNAFITSLGSIQYNYKNSEQIECSAEFTFNQLSVNMIKK